MNEKITFPRLASLLAQRSGRSKRFCEDFLREFFTLISEKLEAGESVKVKGLGLFRLTRVEPRKSVDVTTGLPMEISEHSKVVFVPSKELAESVNSPFEVFTAIEISDNIDLSRIFAEEEMEFMETDPESGNDSNREAEREKEEDSIPAPATEHNNTNEDSTEQETLFEDIAATDPAAGMAIGKQATNTGETEDQEMAEANEIAIHYDEETATGEEEETLQEEERKNKWLPPCIWTGVAAVVLVAILGGWYVFRNEEFNRIFGITASVTTKHNTETKAATSSFGDDEKSAFKTDVMADTVQTTSVEEVPTTPSDAALYDTIGTSRFLTTMARTHYGDYNFWPYIYEENKSILGHPDRIRPGTPVVIPDLKKYGVDPSRKEDIEKAKEMGIEIYARYGKKI